ncbi:S8 family serine peptidase [Rugamonas sp.]|uniref:S8 family serine peptidase n=1 Tax=Rugamonas sp. TaxID=1926287 RepID=UPI0025D30816|nr:S8 family serine peptidase [Rugamonas sp.]
MAKITAAVLLLSGAAAATAEPLRHSYIVQLVDKPAASYTGQVAGLTATKPAAGQRLNVGDAHVQAYINYLDVKKADVISTVSAAQIVHTYSVVFNGFSAMLTDDEARALKKNSGVAKISANVLLHTSTSYTPTFLGLNKAGGLWEQVGGQGAAGEDVIIGMLDTGVWPENPGFADHVDKTGAPTFDGGTLAYGAAPARWKGICEPGQGFSPSSCNNKLIGARIFPPAAEISPYEYISVRDSIGHGTHTATTAAGDAGVVATVGGIAMGKISGMAPRARLAIYKVCWTADYGGGNENACPAESTIAAVEQAVKDGVNVISFSIGDSRGGGTFDDPTEQAFLGAANAGVFVAAAAGNQGPETTAPAPVTHISPWLTTVANSTHNRSYVGSAVLGNGVTLSGASSNANTASAPLLLAKDAGKLGTSPGDIRVAQCYGPEDSVGMPFDPAKVRGKILVCDRGGNVLVNKVSNALAAGAVGVVIVNVDGGATTLPGQPYSLSMVHLSLADGKTLKSYVASAAGKAVASLGNVRATYDSNPAAAPIVAGSSSRGPNVADANILKPDLSAPGTDILAGTLPLMLTEAEFDAPFTGGTLAPPAWEFMTGTSMATPHVSGVAAVLSQLHPDWSPAAIKSALMTTAFDTQSDGRSGALAWDGSALDTGKLPWGQGAGQMAASAAADPGLIYDLGPDDYKRFLCGQTLTVAMDCGGVTALASTDLNLASLSAEKVLGVQVLHRTVTNVGAANASYTGSASVPGFKADVQPATLTLAPGGKGDFTVTLTRTDATMHAWRYGALTWSDGNGHQVHSPLLARAAALDTPEDVYSEAAAGSKIVGLRSGYTGAVAALKGGLLAATQASATVGETQYDVSCPYPQDGVNVTPVTIPAGTLVARFALYNADTSDGAQSDLDLYLATADGTLIAASARSGSDEMVTWRNPTPGNYFVCVAGFAPAGGSATYKLSSWMVGPSSTGGNLKVALPGVLYQGKTATAGYSWSGLDSGKRYLGMVNYLVGGVAETSTLLEVDTTDPLPSFSSGRAKAKQVK